MRNAIIDEGHTVTPVDDILEWAAKTEYIKTQHGDWWIVKQEDVGDTWVSTVFLFLNHRFGPGSPLWFETTTRDRDGEWGEECERYATWDEAEAGHKIVCEHARGRQDD